MPSFPKYHSLPNATTPVCHIPSKCLPRIIYFLKFYRSIWIYLWLFSLYYPKTWHWIALPFPLSNRTHKDRNRSFYDLYIYLIAYLFRCYFMMMIFLRLRFSIFFLIVTINFINLSINGVFILFYSSLFSSNRIYLLCSIYFSYHCVYIFF